MIERKKYKQHWIPGSIVQIDLGDGSFGYGQVLEAPQVAFYDCKTEGDFTPELKDIIKNPVIFKLSIMKYCITQDWKRIGKVQLDEDLNKWPDRFRMDAISKELFIQKQFGPEIPATWKECQHLECAAVWGPQGVEQRLRDYFAGRPCFSIESLKPNWKFIPIKEFYKKYGYNYIEEGSE